MSSVTFNSPKTLDDFIYPLLYAQNMKQNKGYNIDLGKS